MSFSFYDLVFISVKFLFYTSRTPRLSQWPSSGRDQDSAIAWPIHSISIVDFIFTNCDHHTRDEIVEPDGCLFFSLLLFLPTSLLV